MFSIPPQILAQWKTPGATDFPRMGDTEFTALETLWGFALPEDFKVFHRSIGAVTCFPESYCEFDYVLQRPSQSPVVHSAAIRSMTPFETLQLNHHYLIENPDNDAGVPFFPPSMLPVGCDAGTNLILVELSPRTPGVWFWEDDNDAFGHGSNVSLGFIAPTLRDFWAKLRPSSL